MMRICTFAARAAPVLLAVGCAGRPALSPPGPGPAAVPFAKKPDVVLPLDLATGLALADINGDGFNDIIAAGGNDMGCSELVVYLNDGKGGFPREPSWRADEKKTYMNVAVGDVNHDGWLDVAVAVGLGPKPGEAGEPSGCGQTPYLGYGWTEVYYNRGGVLEKTPSWKSEDRYTSFACAFGDADGDGDLDLGVGVFVLKDKPAVFQGPIRIYTNQDGTLERTPSWTARDTRPGFDVRFGDLDGDGRLDFATAAAQARIYFGVSGTAGQVGINPDNRWTAAGTCLTGLGTYLAIGPIGKSGAPGLVVSAQCPPALMPFAAYVPTSGEGPLWTSESTGKCSGVALMTLGDGAPSLVAGRWNSTNTGGDPLQIYRGDETAFGQRAIYNSDDKPFAEAVAVGSLTNRALAEADESFSIDGARAVVTLSRPTIERLVEVKRDGAVVRPSEYAWVPGQNWISFARRLTPGQRVDVRYTWSRAPDIVVAVIQASGAGGPPAGAWIFYNQAAQAR